MQSMGEKDRFRFKHFSVSHCRSALKVGVDGVLVGAWADVGSAVRILDVGTGCGLIALMAAQRNPKAVIDAIDIDIASCEEAEENFFNSPWSDRLRVINLNFCNRHSSGLRKSYDLIITNPPFFSSGVQTLETSRQAARHQASLPLEILINHSAELLDEAGRLALILPQSRTEEALRLALNAGLGVERECRVRGNERKEYKRVMLQFRKAMNVTDKIAVMEDSNLTLNELSGDPTQAYLNLCADFYLKF
ncbi:MAG: methyltransferase [Muribaculum sp.]|nr:methyltransferase [Muribaculum sp.]